MLKILLLTVTALLVSGGQLCWKMAANNIQFADGSFFKSVYILITSGSLWLGFAAYGLGIVLWIPALARIEISLAIPLVSALTMLFAQIYGLVFFGEAVTPQKLIACGLFIIGSVLLARA